MISQYINGECISGTSEVINVYNPADGSVVDSFNGASESQTADALNAAKEAFKTWSWTSVDERVAWLLKYRDAIIKDKEYIIQLLTKETGKPYKAACHDLQMGLDCINFYSEEIKRIYGKVITDYHSQRGSAYHVVSRRPLGVVVGHLAWNFPMFNAALKIGPSIVSGCCCIIKPSEQAPLSVLHLGEILHKIGLPKGVVNIVCGDPKKIGYVLNSSKIPQMITLIGSSKTGLQVMSEGNSSIKSYSLELGGNAPAIIMEDADIEKAAQITVDLKTYNCGQTCTNFNRIYVHSSVYNDYCKLVKSLLVKVKLGVGQQENKIVMGPLISKAAKNRMKDLITDAQQKGANLICGGDFPEDKKEGNYITPALIIDTNDDMRLSKEEIFGPIIAVRAYDSFEQVLKDATNCDYGLSSFIFGHNTTAIARAFEVFESGEILVNQDFHDAYLPHLGNKQSGVGCDCSYLSLEEYFCYKRLSIQP